MGPLVRRAVLRSLHDGPWTLLVLAAFTVACAAAATAPIYAASVANAALADQISTGPTGARAEDAPVVRVIGGVDAAGAGRLSGALDGVPGLGARTRTASSIGAETKPWDAIYTPYVTFEGRSERVRVYGDDEMPAAMVPQAGAGRPTSAAGTAGVWLPRPVADRLGAGPGDVVRLGIRTRTTDRHTDVVLAGTYQVGPDGRLPADPAGTHRWTYRRASVPLDSEFGTRPAYLALTDVAGATALATKIGDPLLFSVEARLDPPQPSMPDAERTVAAIHALEVRLREPTVAGQPAPAVREQVVSGLPRMVEDAGKIAAQTRTWTRPLLLAGVALGLLLVTAVAVLSAMRRRAELATTATWGLRPPAVAALAALEVVPAALLGAVVGTSLTWTVLYLSGPPGALDRAPVPSAAANAVLVAAAGCLVVAALTWVVVRRAARLRADRSTVTLPWEPALVLVAATAAAGLLVRADEVGHASTLDVLVPVLVVAACGAVVGRATLSLLGRARSAAPGHLRRPVAALARARAARSGRQAVLVVTVLAAGLGLLGYSLSAARSVNQVVQDRTAVLAGAGATASVGASWLLDPEAAQMPEPDEHGGRPPGPVLASRTPPLPAGTTVVWHARADVPPDLGNVDLLVVDPKGFASAAAWGVGPQLADARAATLALGPPNTAVVDRFREGGHDVPVPALVVGDIALDAGQQASLLMVTNQVPISVRSHLAAYPGHHGGFPLVVVPADAFFLSLGPADPRLKPPARTARIDLPSPVYHPSLWSRDDAGIRAIAFESLAKVTDTTSITQVSGRPDLVAARRATGPQTALGALVALAAALVLVMYADRRARTGQAADVLLARMGLGRSGVLASRARELALLAALGLVGGVLGAALLTPLGGRLLDPGGGVAPGFALRPGWGEAVIIVTVTLVVWVVASGLVAVRTAHVDEAEVLRDAE